MKKYQIGNLTGHDGRPIHSLYWQAGDQSSDTVVCVFPGLSYPTEAPITFYQKLYFLDSGIDWISFDYRYSENKKFMSMSEAEKSNYFNGDQKVFAEYINRELKGKNVILLGKSLGTAAVSEILKHLNLSSFKNKIRIILETPIDKTLGISQIIEENKLQTLVIIGNRDHFYNQFKNSDLSKCIFVMTREIDGAGHIFEDYTHDLEKSIYNLYKPIPFIEEYLKETTGD